MSLRSLSARPDRRVSEGGQTVTAESNGLTRILGRVCVRCQVTIRRNNSLLGTK